MACGADHPGRCTTPALATYRAPEIATTTYLSVATVKAYVSRSDG